MKKFYSWMTAAAVVLAFGFSSCSDDNNEGPSKESAEPELISFSFNEADNSEVLSADYAGIISEVDKTVKVTMPAFADKSSLVATFTVGEDNKVYVNGVTQQSGVTANDFSAPVDYIISNADGTKNVKYTVTVEKAANYEWTQYAVFEEKENIGSPVMKINPVDNLPYVAFVSKDDKKVNVIKNENGVFSYVGNSAGASEEVTSQRFDFTISNTGTPYFVYADAACAELKSAPSVMKFEGGAWTNVGQQGFVGFVPSKVQIGTIGNEIIAPMIVNANKGDFKKRELYASVYNGSWNTSALTSAGVTDGTVECLTTTDNAAYLYSISTAYNYSVSKYQNGSWTSLRNNYLDPGATQAPVLMTKAASILATNDGEVYVLTGDDAVTGNVKDMRFKVLKYSPDTDAWTLVGGDVITSVNADDSHISAKLALAPDGTLFFAFNTKTDKTPKVQYFDSETKQWTEPTKISDLEADDINIAFCDNGDAFVSFVSAFEKRNLIVLMKYGMKN